jgi:hypothetical protein
VYLESAPINATVPQSLRAQEIVVVEIAPAYLEATIPESIIAVKASTAESIMPTVPNHVADDRASCRSRTAAVPTTVTRVMTVHESVDLFLLPAVPATSLREAGGRDCHEQNQARDY